MLLEMKLSTMISKEEDEVVDQEKRGKVYLIYIYCNDVIYIIYLFNHL